MFDRLKKELFDKKFDLLLAQGFKNGDITPFDDEFYDEMSHTYVNCLPISIEIKYLRPILGPGRCYDRSLYMFFCFPDAVLVRGKNKILEFKYGKDKAGHGWIEKDGYCYDPTSLYRFKKEIYYNMYKPYDIVKYTVEDYRNISESNKHFYDEVINTRITDFQSNGNKRIDLCSTIPIIKTLAIKNKELKNELDAYLKLIQYDEKQIFEKMREETIEAFSKSLNNHRVKK